MKFTNKFYQDCNQVWQVIASDAIEFCDDDEQAWEMILDAGRLARYGSEKSQAELDTVLRKTPWSTVIEYLASKHPVI
jgi:hypothetical protein